MKINVENKTVHFSTDMDVFQYVEKHFVRPFINAKENVTQEKTFFPVEIEELNDYLQKRLKRDNKPDETIFYTKVENSKHVKDQSGNLFGPVTVATIVIKGYIYSGISVCSSRDTYNRKKGNMIALGRARTRPVEVLGAPNDKQSFDFIVKRAHFDVCGAVGSNLLKVIAAQSNAKRISIYQHVVPFSDIQ